MQSSSVSCSVCSDKSCHRCCGVALEAALAGTLFPPREVALFRDSSVDEEDDDREAEPSSVQWLQPRLFEPRVIEFLQATIWYVVTSWFLTTPQGRRVLKDRRQRRHRERRRVRRGGWQASASPKETNEETTTTTTTKKKTTISEPFPDSATRLVEASFLQAVQRFFGFAFGSLVQDSCHYGDMVHGVLSQPVDELAKRAEFLKEYHRTFSRGGNGGQSGSRQENNEEREREESSTADDEVDRLQPLESAREPNPSTVLAIHDRLKLADPLAGARAALHIFDEPPLPWSELVRRRGWP